MVVEGGRVSRVVGCGRGRGIWFVLVVRVGVVCVWWRSMGVLGSDIVSGNGMRVRHKPPIN